MIRSKEDRSSKESSTPLNIESRTSENAETEEQESRELAFQKEWLAKKTLFEAAEKQKEHLINFYMTLNKRYAI